MEEVLVLCPWKYPANVSGNEKATHEGYTFACASDQAAIITPIVNRITEMTCKRE
jgi:hypothetical protein